MNELKVILQNGQLLVDSREVAEMVGKRHTDLLRSIDGYVAILTNAKLRSLDFFIESSYIDSKGEERKCYHLTKKGCDMVANKLTGEKGVLFTAAYVTRFEEMESKLKNRPSAPSYMIDDPIARAEKWIEEQKQRKLLEVKTLMLEQQVAEAEPKLTYYDTILQSTNLVTITQIAKDYGLSGQALNRILHEQGVQYKLGKQWLLYTKHADKGYTKSHTYVDDTGEARMNTKWTQKGRLFIHTILTNLGYNPDDKKIA